MGINGLYAVTPSDLSTGELVDRLRGAFDGGVRLLQLRRKGSSAKILRKEAYLLRELTRACDATLIVNDDLALALEIGADGVHWGREDAPFGDAVELGHQIRNAKQRAARTHPDRPFLVGISCYDDFDRAEAAATAGADYLAFGSMFISSTKPLAVPAAVSLITRAKQAFKVPIVAIGGITRDNADLVVGAGADAVAVVSDLFSATTRDEVAARARRYQALFCASPIHTIPSRATPMFEHSKTLFEKSQRVIPGGVNSPVRAFRAVGGTPVFFRKGKGAYLWDVDGNQYIDYVGSWGPAILGHAHPEVVAAVQERAVDGLSFGAPTEAELLMAEKLCELMPSIEQVRLVSSGTEATMSAIRLARGATGRKKIVKFEGCYHGHADALLVKAGSGALTFGNPSSAGVPAEVAADTVVIAYNSLTDLEQTFAEIGNQIACVIIEPIAGNMNFIVPDASYMHALRALCTKHGAVLIFDEVMTGFRVGLHGVQGHFGIKPDLTTLGKVIGGGMPVGAFGGRRDLMANMAPLGGVYQAGTLSGNPVAVAAGLKTLELVSKPGFFEELSASTKRLCDGMSVAAKEEGETFSATSLGGMFGMFFSASPPTSYADVMQSNRDRFNRFFHGMLERGVYLAPSAFEAGFVSKAHTDADIDETIARARETFRMLNRD